MLSSLTLTNYRGFEHYRINEVNQVNLLVGKNNCGKSSILEAIHSLTSKGNPYDMFDICIRRGELIEVSRDFNKTFESVPDFSHIVYGHRIQLEKEVSISGDSSWGNLSITAKPAQAKAYNMEQRFDLQILYSKEDRSSEYNFPIWENGAVPLDVFRSYSEPFGAENGSIYIDIQGYNRGGLRKQWNEIQLNSKEDEVVNALRILDPSLNKLVFLTFQARSGILTSNSEILIDSDSKKRRIPLGSYGEGLRRIVSLAISLVNNKSGILLVDEIDTGLHYSLMGELWKFIMENATRYNVKVFATTHSYDCIRGLAWYCKNFPDRASAVSLHKVDRRLDEAVTMTGEEISIAHDSNIEVR